MTASTSSGGMRLVPQTSTRQIQEVNVTPPQLFDVYSSFSTGQVEAATRIQIVVPWEVHFIFTITPCPEAIMMTLICCKKIRIVNLVTPELDITGFRNHDDTHESYLGGCKEKKNCNDLINLFRVCFKEYDYIHFYYEMCYSR